MEAGEMFERIDFYIHDNKIEVGGKEFLLGELTADMLDVTPAEFGKMNTLCESIPTENDQESMRQLHELLMKRKLFQLISEQDALGTADRYREIVGDIYSFNQTMFHFIDKFVMRLRKLDVKNYAAALYDFYTHPSLDKMMVNFFRDGFHSFTLFDEIEVRYVPREVPASPGRYAVYEIYAVRHLQAFLKMDFMKAIMNGHTIRRCKNCKRFFLLTKGYKTDYCDRPIEGKPHRNCRNQGAKNKAKEKAANNPVIHSYTNAYQRITADKERGNISEEDWRKAKREIIDLKDRAISGGLTDLQLEETMKSKQLYDSLGIVRKRGGK